MHSGYLYISKQCGYLYIYICSVAKNGPNKVQSSGFPLRRQRDGDQGTAVWGSKLVSTVHCGSSQICGENSNQLGARHCKQRIIKIQSNSWDQSWRDSCDSNSQVARWQVCTLWVWKDIDSTPGGTFLKVKLNVTIHLNLCLDRQYSKDVT